MPYRKKATLWLVLIAVVAVPAITLGEGGDLDRIFLIFALCFACEFIDSGLGMGYGTILTPVLLLIGYEPRDIVPTVLLSELLSGFAAALFHHQIKNVDLAYRGRDFFPALFLAGGSIAGVTAGVFTAVRIPQAALTLAIGCVILTAGVFVILLSRRLIVYRWWKMILLATVASFNKAISGGGYGPLVTSGQILSGVHSKASVGITSLAEAFTCLFAVGLFLWQGGCINLSLFLPMCAGALSSVPFAVFAINRANENHLKTAIGVLSIGMGLMIVVKAIN